MDEDMGAGSMDDWKAKLTDEEVEEGIDIFERACAEGDISAAGGRQMFSTSSLRNELQSLIEIRDTRRQQPGSNPSKYHV